MLSRAIAAICDIEWPTRVTDLLAAQLVELGLYTADEIASNKDTIVSECLASKKLYPLVTTTCAPTQIEGGSTGANVMPQDMWANINFRMLEGTSVADVVARCRVAVAEAGLADRVEVELGPGSSEPSPSPRIGGPGLEAVRSIAARYFRDPKGDGGKRIIRAVGDCPLDRDRRDRRCQLPAHLLRVHSLLGLCGRR